MAPSLAFEIKLLAIRHFPASGDPVTEMPTRACPDDVAGRRNVAHERTPADLDTNCRSIFDRVADDDRVGLDADAFAALIILLVLAAKEVADQIALNDGEAAAFVEVGHRNARGRRIDEIVGDQCTFKTEFGIKRDFAEPFAAVCDDLDVGCRVAAHRRVSAIRKCGCR